MKKLFTLLVSSLVSLTSMAQTTDYKCALAVLVNGAPADPQDMVVTTTKADNGTYTLQLKNFILYTQGQAMPVGTITVPNIQATEEEGDIVLKSEQNITIADGDMPGVEGWMGSILGEVPISLEGGISGDVLGAVLDIPFNTMNICVYVSSGKTQLPNSDFEGWHETSFKDFSGTTTTSDEPNSWHSFMSCTGSLAGIVSGAPHTWKSNDVRPNSSSKTSVLVKSAALFGSISANGTITTGRLMADDMTPSNPKNNSFLDLSNSDKDANGDPFYTKLDSYPDSIAMWVKFHPGKGNNNPTALVSAVLTDGTYYQDPEDKEYANVVAKAQYSSIESNGEVWQRIVVPFDYESYYTNDAEARAMLVTISTCSVPGGGSASADDPDAINVDDVSLIYNAKLNSISIKGAKLVDFDKNKFDYNVEVEVLPEPKDIDFEEDAENSMVSLSLNDNVATLTVISNDLKTINTYKLNFKLKDANAISNVNNGAKAAVTTYNLNGQQVSASAKGNVVIKKYADGTTRKVMK